MLKSFVLVASVALVAGGQLSRAVAEEAEVPLDRLVKLNQDQLFGGPVEILDAKQGRIRIRYGKGQFTNGFLVSGEPGRGFIADQALIKDPNLKEKLLGGVEEASFSLVGLDRGVAVSKFELADEFKISFKLKIPTLLPAGTFVLRFNQDQRMKSFIQTSFFQDIRVNAAGKMKRKVVQNKTYQQPPFKWFDTKSKGVPWEIVFGGKKLSISTQAVEGQKEKEKEKGKDKEKEKEKDKEKEKVGTVEEMVSQEGIEAPSSGRISFEFNKLSFAITDLVIEGKYNGSWLDSEIAKLKKAGKLKVKEPEVAKKEDKPAAGDAKGGSSKAAPTPVRKKTSKGNVDEPDPEGDDEL